jgi:hypothetical protein
MASRTQESKDKVKAVVEALKAKDKERTPEQIAFSKKMIARSDRLLADEYFDSDGVKVSRTLAKQLGYELGNDDGEL